MKDQLQELATTARKYTEGECSLGALQEAIENALMPQLPKLHQQSDADEVCPACGDDQIEAESWVLINTGEVRNSSEGGCWCPTCEDHFKYPVSRREFQAEHGVRP
jgi:hypothetical protein